MKNQKINVDGTNLLKVLWYYGFIPTINSNVQKIICPFHKDVNPSLICDFDNGRWFCFGCNKSGDSLNFVLDIEKQYNNLNDLQALHKYFKILKSNKCKKIHLKKNTRPQAELQIDLLNEAHDYYYGLKKVNWYNPDFIEEKECKDYMLKRGFTIKALMECDARYTYTKNYPLIFPMLDNGEFKGWVCRTTNKDVEKKRKYLYNKGFSRANTLVGDYGKKPYIIVVEGYMDRLKFIQFNESNVVAILGWKISDQQIKKLKDNGITTVISALDNDKCGKNGTKYLQRFFNVVRFKYLKGVKDVGEMNKAIFNKCLIKTKQAFRQKEEFKNESN